MTSKVTYTTLPPSPTKAYEMSIGLNLTQASIDLLDARHRIEKIPSTREHAMIITKIDEALLWLGRAMEMNRATNPDTAILQSVTPDPTTIGVPPIDPKVTA